MATLNTIAQHYCIRDIKDLAEAHATATNSLWGVWAIHIAKRKLIVGSFDHEGLHQLQNSFVADEDLRGRNVLLLTSFLLRELLKYPRERHYDSRFLPYM